jgi:tRNA(fMet)-specific endonuclease VapC
VYVLDTDHIGFLEQSGTAESRKLRSRLAGLPSGEVATTIINFEEQARGWLAYSARARSLARQVEAYRRLRTFLDNYRAIPILDFDSKAAVDFQRLQRMRLRIGTMDLKIAAIVLAHGAILLSRNRADFSKVPGLLVEDWTV